MDKESESREALEEQVDEIRQYNDKDILQRTSLLDELGEYMYLFLSYFSFSFKLMKMYVETRNTSLALIFNT